MSDQQPSTEDILAKIRGGAGKPAAAKPAVEAQPAAEPAAQSPAATTDILAAVRGGGAGAESGGDKPAAPKSTADVLAAVKSGGGVAPAKPPAAPGGTADILASLRAGKAGGTAAAPAPAAKPIAKAASEPKVDTAAASGMSAAEMVRAAREGKVSGGKAKVPGKVVLPAKPLAKPGASASVAKVSEQRESRRTALQWLLSPVVVAWVSMAAAATASTLAMARFMMPNVLVEPPTRFKIGPPTDYGPGTVATKWKAQFGVWIVNGEVDGRQMIYALSTVCTHLGCTPNWLEGEQKFKCPCHGSGFYRTGVNFEGPAPRPLERMGIRLAEDGMLEVDKSVKFQQELGQWENAASFVPVA